MPVLRKIVVKDFRNIELQELEFSPNVNCISGGNGEGKTNLLDAIHYLSMTKSGINVQDRFNFRHGCRDFEISGRYDMPSGIVSNFSIKVESEGEKKLRRDDKPVSRISSHIGVLPVVLVSPADSALVSESGEERRRFVNAVLSQMDSAYLAEAQQYNRLLGQRNKLLKDPDPDMSLLEVMDIRMSKAASGIYARRSDFCRDILPIVDKYYTLISGGRESIGLEYSSDLKKGSFEEVMLAHRERDLVLKYTTSGLQRDDFLFLLDGHPIRKCGSQGQQKSFLVALKFAQYELMKERCGVPPILLLDDLFDKLDPGRVANLLKIVAGSDFGQIFISDSDKVRTGAILEGITDECAHIVAENGKFTRQDGR